MIQTIRGAVLDVLARSKKQRPKQHEPAYRPDCNQSKSNAVKLVVRVAVVTLDRQLVAHVVALPRLFRVLKSVAIPYLERQLAHRWYENEDDQQSQWGDLQKRCLACFADPSSTAQPFHWGTVKCMMRDNTSEKEAKEHQWGKRVYQKPISVATKTILRRQDDRHPVELKRSEDCQHVCEVSGQLHREVVVDVRADLIEGEHDLQASRMHVSTQEHCPRVWIGTCERDLKLGSPAQAFQDANEEACSRRKPGTEPVQSMMRAAARR